MSEVIGRLWGKSEAALRFNRSFANATREIRDRIGSIAAEHSAKGQLRSGATILRSIDAAEAELKAATNECLDYISANTSHRGWKRKKLTALCLAISKHHQAAVWLVLESKALPLAGNRGGAAEAAEQQFRTICERSDDLIQKYAEGIKAPPDVRWNDRYPLSFQASLLLLAAVVGWIAKSVL